MYPYFSLGYDQAFGFHSMLLLYACQQLLCAVGSFNAVDLKDLETATHYVKYAVAAYAIIPVTDEPDKK